MAAVTAADVRRVAQQFLNPDRLTVVVAGKLAYRGRVAELMAGQKSLEAALRGLYQKGAEE